MSVASHNDEAIGSDSMYRELLSIILGMSDWELRPLVFMARRLQEGRAKYGPGEKQRDWLKEAAEEAADLVNYYVWSKKNA